MKSPFRYLRGVIKRIQANAARKSLLRSVPAGPLKIPRPTWPESLSDPTGFYIRCHQFFNFELPEDLRAHRDYFSREGRGFGEDAFHTMWSLLFEEFKPRDFLEVGVWRGQSLSLASLLQKLAGYAGEIVGISPFRPAGDSMPHYWQGLDYYEDTLGNFAHFALPKPRLVRAFSTDPEGRKVFEERRWDCIFIDGDHEYDAAKADWQLAAANVKDGGLIVMDDASFTTKYDPPAFASKGIIGPSKVSDEVDRSQFEEILRVGHNRVFRKKSP